MNQQNRDHLFAFAHGVRLTVESLGLSINDSDVMNPILEAMDTIISSPKQSLVRSHDDLVEDWDQFRRLRQIEQNVCQMYLNEVIAQQSEGDA